MNRKSVNKGSETNLHVNERNHSYFLLVEFKIEGFGSRIANFYITIVVD